MSKLKIGDWVKETLGEIGKIKNIKDDGIIELDFVNFSVTEDELKLWQPKKDEWCWFWSINSNINNYKPQFKRFSKFDEKSEMFVCDDLT